MYRVQLRKCNVLPQNIYWQLQYRKEGSGSISKWKICGKTMQDAKSKGKEMLRLLGFEYIGIYKA